MAKGYIIVDVPESCKSIRGNKSGCPFGGMVCNIDPLNPKDVLQYTYDGTKPDWCPIKEMPSKLKPNEVNGNFDFLDGYNDLIDEMFGEEE